MNIKFTTYLLIYILFFTGLSFVGIAQPKFDGNWKGSIEILDQKDEFKIRIDIDGNNAIQYFWNEIDRGWVKSPSLEYEYRIIQNNAILIWMNYGGLWTETQVFSLSYVNSNSLSVLWLRHVNNKSGSKSESWHLFGKGNLKIKDELISGQANSIKLGRNKGEINRNMRVVRGVDWEYDDKDGGGVGTIMEVSKLVEWVRVKWDNGFVNTYRWGLKDKYDLKIISPVEIKQLEENMKVRVRKNADKIMGKPMEKELWSLLDKIVVIKEISENGIWVWDVHKINSFLLPVNALEYAQ